MHIAGTADMLEIMERIDIAKLHCQRRAKAGHLACLTTFSTTSAESKRGSTFHSPCAAGAACYWSDVERQIMSCYADQCGHRLYEPLSHGI